jgi:hypothetical protein
VGSLADERDRLARIEALQTAITERNAAQANAAPLEAKRREAWTALRAVDSKLAVLAELQMRFDLLQEQYSSDLRRLEAIAEAGVRLDQLKEERCPMCGALAEHHDNAHREARLAPANVSQACKAEAAKTFKLLHDLQATRAATAAEVGQLRTAREARQEEFDAIAAELKVLLEQHVDVATKKVDELRAREGTCRKALELLERVQELEALLEQASAPKKKERADGPASAVSTAQADPFSREVEALLRAWHFPDLDRVSFSENDQDIVISGRTRKSHGKGVRAITRAAFNLALLRFCVKGERPFPNFVLLDSPLLVYEEPDADEAFVPPGHQEALLGEREVIFRRRAGRHHREQQATPDGRSHRRRECRALHRERPGPPRLHPAAGRGRCVSSGAASRDGRVLPVTAHARG